VRQPAAAGDAHEKSRPKAAFFMREKKLISSRQCRWWRCRRRRLHRQLRAWCRQQEQKRQQQVPMHQQQALVQKQLPSEQEPELASQPRELVQVLLLFCRKQRGQQQQRWLPERGTCSFG
jgi:hypothetical protein